MLVVDDPGCSLHLSLECDDFPFAGPVAARRAIALRNPRAIALAVVFLRGSG